ncbi:MAG TPA: ribokinase [Acidimicrobiaceae bacterium]|nr:ribokinase [Acidimicrobiaceae bacterium]HAX05750.1 ribokinase [Acidimicrobiaceae bacterium]
MAVQAIVVGSLNYDITVWVPRRPEGDETLHGDRCEENGGGKGANQAIAAARLGAEVVMVGCVGSDSRGDYLVAQLDAAGVNRKHVYRASDSTGTALITIDPEDVSIVVIAGANRELDSAKVELAMAEISRADVLLLQGEVAADAARTAAVLAAASSVKVVFNPAPFNEVVPAVLPLADVVIVNRHEAEQLGDVDVPVLVTTLGAQGCEVKVGSEITMIEAPIVEVADPTGAGDAFVGAFSVAYVDTGDPVAAALIAVRAGAAAVSSVGAQPSMPTWEQIDGV